MSRDILWCVWTILCLILGWYAARYNPPEKPGEQEVTSFYHCNYDLPLD